MFASLWLSLGVLGSVIKEWHWRDLKQQYLYLWVVEIERAFRSAHKNLTVRSGWTALAAQAKGSSSTA